MAFLTPVDQSLQLIAWFLALIEFILALYILLLNARHMANRHVSGILLLFAANTFAVGLLMSARTVEEAQLPTYFLTATVPVISPGLLLLTVALLKPGWLSGRRRRVWWPVYAWCLIPALLTGLDVGLGTRLFYSGPNPETYRGGFVYMAEYADGSLFPLFWTGFFVALAATVGLALYVACLDKVETQLTCRLAWLLLASNIAATVVEVVLLDTLGTITATLITNTIFILAYAYAAFQQMISERRLQRGRLQTRLTVLVLVITAPILVAVVTLVSARSGALILQHDTEHLRTVNQSLAANVSLWLDFNVKALQQVVSQPDFMSLEREQQESALRGLVATYPHIYLAGITDLRGVNLARSDGELPQDYSDQFWFRQASDGVPLTFQTLMERTRDEPALVASVPVRDRSGQIAGVGMFASDLSAVAHKVQASRIGDTGFAYVIDTQDRVVAHPHPHLAFSGDLHDFSAYPPIVALRQGRRGSMTFSDDEGQQWRAYVDELYNGWGVAVQQQESELLSGVRHLQQVSWTALTVGVAMLFVLAWLTVRQTFRPIQALIETVGAIRGGDLSRTAPVESDDEIGSLATAFNEMTAQLRGLIDNLEQRVAERTRELEQRSVQLAAAAAENARLFEQAQQEIDQRQRAEDALAERAVQLMLLNDIGGEIAGVLELKAILQKAARLVHDNFGYHHVALFTLDHKQGDLQLRACAGSFAHLFPADHRLGLGQGMVGWVGLHGQRLLANDVAAEPSYVNSFPGLMPTQAELTVPIRVSNEVVGVLDIQSPQCNAFGQEDVVALSTLADQIAVAIENARLYAAIQQELAERKRAEQELARSNAELQQFAYAASHDLREPLRKVQIFSGRLSAKYTPALDERGLDYLARMQNAAARMQALIDGLLDYSRVTSKAQPFEPVDLDRVARGVMSDLEVQLEQVGGRVEVGHLPTVEADPTQMRQLFQNLIGNALKFHRKDATPLVKIYANPPEEHAAGDTSPLGRCQISVEDNGIGFEEKYLERIFQVFQRLHGRSEYEGTGIGLATCRKIVERHRGSITAKSAPGQGATFIISLPLRQPTVDNGR